MPDIFKDNLKIQSGSDKKYDMGQEKFIYRNALLF